MSEPSRWAPRLDLSAASALKTTLSDAKADDIELDSSEVQFLGALCLQVLITAATDVAARGGRMKLSNMSERVSDQLRVMGMSPDSIARGHQ